MINLLPNSVKEARHTKSKLYVATTLYLIGAAILVLGPLALLTYNFTLKGVVDDLTNQVQALEKQKSSQTSLISEAAFLEDRISAAPHYQSTPDWNALLDQIAASTPTDT